MGANDIATQRQFLVSVDGLPDYYATISGGEVTAETSDAWDGGATKPEITAGPASTGNLVISRPFRIQRDSNLVARLEKLVGKWRTTITKQPVDADLTPVGLPTTYPQSLLIRVTPPEADAASSESATYELEFRSPGPA